MSTHYSFLFFFFNDPATTEIYTLSLHDALPISTGNTVLLFSPFLNMNRKKTRRKKILITKRNSYQNRSEEHTSELQSRPHLVCRLLLEKKNKQNHHPHTLYP